MIELKRRPDWREHYEAAIDEITATPFQWGIHDCGPSLAGRIVKAITGADLCAEYHGTYSDALGAARIIREAGFTSLAEMVGSMLPQAHPSEACIGDIAAIEADGPIGCGLGVVNGERIYVLTETGIGTVDLLEAKMIFKVGRPE
ncbi:hypothetical protein C5748_03820 [Phyllobacterium phragmitis]|uniref:DUF6950 domain-containing protein n=2 Tax=Phyllobacterium phragmitis TaxID=2670329 RepID=A0A2S9IXS4_9HYPH|nr:hypothetical protein C5748_03820 [Phyllobacterium phragmitis]